MYKPTRLRSSKVIRNLVRETTLTMNDIIYPLFVVEGQGVKTEISSMKDQYSLSVDMIDEEIKSLKTLDIQSVIIFGTPSFKDEEASQAFDTNGIVQRAVREIKLKHPDILVITDVCLCQYKSDGHCCFFDKDGYINHKKSLETLDKVALSHAEAGADVVAPSDMMDGRIVSMRKILNTNGYKRTGIMAYSAKYASSFYGPFRDAVDSAPSFGDRKSYQMDISNSREAVREMELDIQEGADFIMIKPAMPYLDIISKARELTNLPTCAYQVSGEYSMLRNAVDTNILDERAIYESLISIKRSGADIIITYFAKEVKRLIKEMQ